MKKTTQLRSMINSDKLEVLMEAHHALSAKIVENTGFKGIWASGLSMSAAMGVRDNNEVSWTQILEVLEFMSDVTSIPILLDGDTGFGNFNNARRLVKKLEQRDIAGVCIEDKLFPKTNSFIKGDTQPLADIEEFSSKIKAMKDTQKDDDFVVISRVEAFIAGWGLREALRRAEAYHKAGTDAILMHSKKTDISEIEAFMKEWGNRLPVVVVPTKYYAVPTETLRNMGISMAIWANHNLRASITAMENVTKKIYLNESLVEVEKEVAPLEKVFHLQGAEELAQAEKKYLTKKALAVNSIILVRKNNTEPLVHQQLDQLNDEGIKNIYTIGSSHMSSTICDVYSDGMEVYSLFQARENMKEETIISHSDILYKQHILQELLTDQNPITIVVDADFEKGSDKYYVTGNEPYSKLLYSKTVPMIEFGKNIPDNEIHGEFIGLWKITSKGAALLQEVFEEMSKQDEFKQFTLQDLFCHPIVKPQMAIKYIKGQWLDLQSFIKLSQIGDSI